MNNMLNTINTKGMTIPCNKQKGTMSTRHMQHLNLRPHRLESFQQYAKVFSAQQKLL